MKNKTPFTNFTFMMTFLSVVVCAILVYLYLADPRFYQTTPKNEGIQHETVADTEQLEEEVTTAQFLWARETLVRMGFPVHAAPEETIDQIVQRLREEYIAASEKLKKMCIPDASHLEDRAKTITDCQFIERYKQESTPSGEIADCRAAVHLSCPN